MTPSHHRTIVQGYKIESAATAGKMAKMAAKWKRVSIYKQGGQRAVEAKQKVFVCG